MSFIFIYDIPTVFILKTEFGSKKRLGIMEAMFVVQVLIERDDVKMSIQKCTYISYALVEHLTS